MNRLSTCATYWKHMRLPFQLTLAPLFLWGAFLSDAALSAPVLAAFVSLHLFLYPGVTAFNSAYDEDEGPVSGMLKPPSVPPGLLAFSIVLQGTGAAIAASVNLGFFATYGTIALLAAAYSHPATRWKANPWASAATVAIGQGVLGFVAGWCAASGELPPPDDAKALLGALVAGLTTLGLYPSTQVFQLEEDAARGDRTMAVSLGAVGALRFGSLCLIGAGAAATWLMAAEVSGGNAALIAAAYGAVIVHNELFARRIAGLTIDSSYRWAMRTSLVSTAGFMVFIALQLLPS